VSPNRTDVIVACTGASAAIAGLVLVFLGVLVTTYQQLLGANTPDDDLQKFKNGSIAALFLFGLSLASLVMTLAWLIVDGGSTFYTAALVVFFVQLAVLCFVAGYSTFAVMLRG
jgi:hypothetical protein